MSGGWGPPCLQASGGGPLRKRGVGPEAPRAVLSSEGLQALCRARARLLAGGDEPLRIRRLAAESGLSPYHFIRRFKAVFGETPHQVRIRSRLERAKELLLCSEESVTEISLRLGFSSLGTFSARSRL